MFGVLQRRRIVTAAVVPWLGSTGFPKVEERTATALVPDPDRPGWLRTTATSWPARVGPIERGPGLVRIAGGRLGGDR